ncbi:hypothetical protein L3V35_23360 [Vibrio sp. L5-1]|uniref:hypothetical protein n=1 Tax=Vibrio sp. L5-1 TaxID=2912254 RepID=UPI001F2B40A4|nr:hypothetical protein [Vibrio sp. L5-1]MCF7497933.1 hypothetical protein [Vibrio sp. L5-1]
MDFVSSALIGGALYELVSSPIKLTASYIKAGLDNVVNLEDKVADIIAEELSKEEYKKSASPEELTGLIESSKVLQEVIAQLNEKPQTVINIKAYGSGDAFNGDKIMGNQINIKDK